jgi:hypothetical protein
MGEVVPGYVWIMMPLLIAGGASLVTAVLMQARSEVAVSRHRETLAEARAFLTTQHRAMEERVRATEETARRRALDEFMGDIRVEERQFFRENGSLVSRRKALVVQERVCFRNIPLTTWVERELPGTAELVRVPLRTPEPVIAPLVVAEVAESRHVAQLVARSS